MGDVASPDSTVEQAIEGAARRLVADREKRQVTEELTKPWETKLDEYWGAEGMQVAVTWGCGYYDGRVRRNKTPVAHPGLRGGGISGRVVVQWSLPPTTYTPLCTMDGGNARVALWAGGVAHKKCAPSVSVRHATLSPQYFGYRASRDGGADREDTGGGSVVPVCRLIGHADLLAS